MNNSNILSITMNLTGWPAAVTCGVGILVIGGATVFLGSKLIDNGYQFTSADGASVTSNNCSVTAEEGVTRSSTHSEPIVA